MASCRIALTKGRLEANSVAMFERMGYDMAGLKNKGRRLIIPVPDADAEIVLAKAPDVITYVERGVCDMGIVGKDTIMEQGGSFYEVLDLGFGVCRFALAAPGRRGFLRRLPNQGDRDEISGCYAPVFRGAEHGRGYRKNRGLGRARPFAGTCGRDCRHWSKQARRSKRTVWPCWKPSRPYRPV